MMANQARWDKVSGRCSPCARNTEGRSNEDFMLWNYDFFNAPVVDLYHSRRLNRGAAQ